MWTQKSIDPRAASDEPVDIAVLFKQALPVKFRVRDKEYANSLEFFVTLNETCKTADIGRVEIGVHSK